MLKHLLNRIQASLTAELQRKSKMKTFIKKIILRIFSFANKDLSLKKYKKNVYNTVFGGDKFKILHANARFFNFGDNALAYGVENLFLQYFRNNCQFIKEDVHSTIFDRYKIEEINKKYELFLVGGGGLIDTGFNPENEFLLFTINQNALIKLSLPMICFGWGFNNFQDF